MKLIRPVTVTDAMLISSTIAEPDGSESAWNSGTTYAAGNEVYLASTHRRYRSVQSSNTNHDPATDDGSWWLNIGGTNKWAMFDDYVSTASIETSSPLTVVFDPGVVDALYLYGMVGDTATITMTNGAGGPTVYTAELDLQVPVVNDWYSYYFEPFRQVPYFVLTDLPPYLNGRITVSIADSGGAPTCGMCIPGRTYTIGGTQYGVEAGIRDYSRKVTDEATGFTTLEQRKFAKTMRAQIRTDAAMFAEVTEKLEQLRSTPCVWVGDSTGDIQPLTMYGYYKDFRLVVDYPTFGLYSLEIEGMV